MKGRPQASCPAASLNALSRAFAKYPAQTGVLLTNIWPELSRDSSARRWEIGSTNLLPKGTSATHSIPGPSGAGGVWATAGGRSGENGRRPFPVPLEGDLYRSPFPVRCGQCRLV